MIELYERGVTAQCRGKLRLERVRPVAYSDGGAGLDALARCA
jgi:hypothetical protein